MPKFPGKLVAIRVTSRDAHEQAESLIRAKKKLLRRKKHVIRSTNQT